jgi:DUF971 family protein
MTAPIRIVVSKSKSKLTASFDSGEEYEFPAEYLRVFSPSAEVRGHGRGQEVLQYGKRDVGITSINQAGNYAIQIIFSDGHDSGIFFLGLPSRFRIKLHKQLDRLFSQTA